MISLVKMDSMEETYQFALKEEYKLRKGKEQRQRGKGNRF